jgi:predicted nucleic acid-binding protein
VIFVDTGGWFASVVPSDRDHARATAWLDANTEPLVTSDYVLDEVLTLLRARGHADLALTMGQDLIDQRTAALYHLDELDIRRAWDVFRQYADKQWSFTDCSSKVVMERLGIATAFAFDQHFRQFGSVRVVP